ncbi:MAG: hypothetical protein CMM76_16295 [Rhodospirillaceae bacterium]|nr:hypothetical protein [Rhodospirillaceae bacterium]|tara:strand:+ start:1277 stop:1516 length:240 start_codon:yes stop_codon:yes gene_type:complete
MRYAAICLTMMLASCTTVEGVMEAESIYCSQIYKGVRAVGRSALSATTGVVVSDVCDQIDSIVSAEEEENASSVSKSDG